MLLSLLSLALAAPKLPSEERPDNPKGPPPKVMVLHGDNDGGLYLQVEVTRLVEEKRAEQVKNGDRVETREVAVTVPVTETIRLSLDDKGVAVYGADGEKITAKALRRVAPPVAVLISADGKPVDALYRKLLRDDGLIVVAAALALPAPESSEPITPPKLPAPRFNPFAPRPALPRPVPPPNDQESADATDVEQKELGRLQDAHPDKKADLEAYWKALTHAERKKFYEENKPGEPISPPAKRPE